MVGRRWGGEWEQAGIIMGSKWATNPNQFKAHPPGQSSSHKRSIQMGNHLSVRLFHRPGISKGNHSSNKINVSQVGAGGNAYNLSGNQQTAWDRKGNGGNQAKEPKVGGVTQQNPVQTGYPAITQAQTGGAEYKATKVNARIWQAGKVNPT